jgi:hypothetical protein
VTPQLPPVHIELVGCTSAGKSVLTRGIERACVRRGVDVVLNDDLVLGRVFLRWVRGEFLRRRIVDLLSLAACARSWRTHRRLIAFALDASRRAPCSWTGRLNIARNVLRKVGIFEIVRRSLSDERVVLVDNEGVLQAAHNLFVHASGSSADAEVATFLGLAPLPDAVVYVQEQEAVMVSRTLARGHRRVPEGSVEDARQFVRGAVRVFERLAAEAAVRRRLVVVDARRDVVVAFEGAGDPRLRAAADLVRDGVEAVREARGERHAEDDAPRAPARPPEALEIGRGRA